MQTEQSSLLREDGRPTLADLATSIPIGAPTFCKCTCFKNSTIIPMGPASSEENGSLTGRLSPDLSLMPGSHEAGIGSEHDIDVQGRTASTSCSDCTKAFCLRQGIDICRDATEDDVTTMCFQRDSNKDKIIVWGFIMGTSGLLGWALFKKVVASRSHRPFSRPDVGYAPVSSRTR